VIASLERPHQLRHDPLVPFAGKHSAESAGVTSVPRTCNTTLNVRRNFRRAVLVVGPTGAGKSTLVATYARERPAVLTETGVTYPVVKATIPTPATIKALAMVLLAALGDPRAM